VKSNRNITQAEIAAEKASFKTGQLILAYQCYDCSTFPIGHAESQRLSTLSRKWSPPIYRGNAGKILRATPASAFGWKLDSGSLKYGIGSLGFRSFCNVAIFTI
jgi:hypothetical protein